MWRRAPPEKEETERLWRGISRGTVSPSFPAAFGYMQKYSCDIKKDPCSIKRDLTHVKKRSKNQKKEGKMRSIFLLKRDAIYIFTEKRCIYWGNTYSLRRYLFIEKRPYVCILGLFNQYAQMSLLEEETRQSPLERVLPLHYGGIWSEHYTQHE